MYISTFDLFKIGIGPSSSHTVGPMIAGFQFSEKLKPLKKRIKKINIELFGSLSLTGKGHGTDKALILGLSGELPDKIVPAKINIFIDELNSTNELKLLMDDIISFNPDKDIIYNNSIKKHKYSNTMIFKAFDAKNNLLIENTFYSIGGGFIIDESSTLNKTSRTDYKVPFEFDSGDQLLSLCDENNLKIYEIVRQNEESFNPDSDIDSLIINIWKTMNSSIYNGMTNSGFLKGNLKIKKRANGLFKKLIKNNDEYDPLFVMDWVNVFAIAVSEENASFGKIVTAPTNGASGIIPSVIKYYKEFTKDSNDGGIINFILTAAAIGTLFKKNASISGAEAGCQGEVGVACSMAAAGLTAALGGSNLQIENAAEIAMEHNLGLTCDPINGLVQIPCIERNAMGAMKAINACRLSLNGTGLHKVSLDQVIKTMWDTGKDMKTIYKETSKGGLAVNVIEC